MTCIVIIKMPSGNLVAVKDEDGNAKQWKTTEEADAGTHDLPWRGRCRAWVIDLSPPPEVTEL